VENSAEPLKNQELKFLRREACYTAAQGNFAQKMAENLVQLARMQLFPIKSLDPVVLREARIGPNGGLELDRAWAMCSGDGRWFNGKRTERVHELRAAFAEDLSTVTLSVAGPPQAGARRAGAFPFP